MCNEFETSIELNGIELPAVIQYDYQPPEAGTRIYPGADEEVTIIGLEVIDPFTNELVDMYSETRDHLMTNKLTSKLEEDALAHQKAQLEAYECDKADYLMDQQRDAA